MTAEFIPRALADNVAAGLASSPIVVIEGARAVGKTRLLTELRERGLIRGVRSLVDAGELGALTSDVESYVASLPSGTAIDEAQLGPGLLLALKRRIDVTGEPGQFVLTGSERFRRNELGGTDPLAGRATTLRLEPLSQSELGRVPSDALERFLADDPAVWSCEPVDRDGYIERARAGGMPAAESRAWSLAQFLDDVILRSDGVVRDRNALQTLLRILSSPARICSPVSYESLGRELDGTDPRTIKSYITLLEDQFLIRRVPAFDSKLGESARRRAKIQPLDPALVGWARSGSFGADDIGGLLETFVGSELVRAASVAERAVAITHWHSGASEVDRIVDLGTGPLLAFEVKATVRPSLQDFAGIAAFAKTQSRDVRGFVLCCIDRVLPFGPDRWAVPLSALWHAPLDAGTDDDAFERALRRGTVERTRDRDESPVRAMREIVIPRLRRIAETISDGSASIVISDVPREERASGTRVLTADVSIVTPSRNGVEIVVRAEVQSQGSVTWTWSGARLVPELQHGTVVIDGRSDLTPAPRGASDVTLQIADAVGRLGDEFTSVAG